MSKILVAITPVSRHYKANIRLVWSGRGYNWEEDYFGTQLLHTTELYSSSEEAKNAAIAFLRTGDWKRWQEKCVRYVSFVDLSNE